MPRQMIFILLIGLAHGGVSQDRPGTQRPFGPFEPDKHTVSPYHFDEGTGELARDACGDPELTLSPWERQGSPIVKECDCGPRLG